MRSRTLGVAAAATFLVLVAFTTPLATLVSTANDLGSGPGGQAWILSSMSVGLAVALLVSGAVGDDYGRRRMLVLGSAVLAVTSVISAVAPNTLVLVLARIGQGIGGAAVISCSLGLIGHAFPAGQERARATGIWGASVGGGIAVGPLVMGRLDETVGWRAGFWLLTAGSVALVVVGRLMLEESRSHQPRRVDIVGATLLGGGLVALLAGLVEGRRSWGWPALPLLVAAVALVVGFVWWEGRVRAPMLDLTLFRRPAFVASIVAGFTTGAGVIGLMSFSPTFLQRALGYTTTQAALLLFAWSGTSAVVALLARRLPATLSVRSRLVLSLVVVAAGLALLTGKHGDVSVFGLLPGLLVAGVGSGVLNAALGQIAVASVPAGQAGIGSGANNTARYVGGALGVTIVAMLAARDTPTEVVSGWDTAAIVTAALTVAGAALVLVGGRVRRPAPVPA
ncbi:MAG: MFS transporter [Actinophytocola sp.]|uniref:MFS transporter n=1 Tax=Actinophytocola sp. TaxID=1872138 RepID=UPI0013258E47|nr:MFS transporter [Actinophytocola sp.]MPZ85800.1 MFS transporter [Actinophytocola sp.]